MTETTLPIQFALADILTEQFAIVDTAYKEEQTDRIQIISSFKFGFNEENQTILASPRFSFEQNEVAFLLLEVACIFKIEQASLKALYKSEGSLQLPKPFAAHIAAIAVGVARGVLHAKTEQTPFNRFMIPLINVNENINEDVVLK
jgi:hypothetical protein